MSNKIMSVLSSSPVDLGIVVNLNAVCVDNKQIRERITKANKFEITTVPCILIVYKEGAVEKYEGVKAFEWVDETIKMIIPPSIPPPNTPPKPPTPRKKSIKKIIKESESESESESEIEVQVETKAQKSKSRRSKKETTMEELGGFEDSNVGTQNYKDFVDPKNQASAKTKDLMSAAIAMQKERDTVDVPKSNGDIITNKRPF